MAMKCFARLGPLVLGAQGITRSTRSAQYDAATRYDSALGGIHYQTFLRKHGLLPMTREAFYTFGNPQSTT